MMINKLWISACVALCASSIASADYLEVRVFAHVPDFFSKYWDYTGYFDFDAGANGFGEFESVYGFGGRMRSPDRTPFYDYTDFANDLGPATLLIKYTDQSSEVVVTCRSNDGPSGSLFISRVDPGHWDPMPGALPEDLSAYEIVPRPGGDQYDMELHFQAPGHSIEWRPVQSGDEEQGPVFYAVRIVEDLPPSAFEPLDFNRDGEINFFDVSRFIELYLDATN